ncbi:ATP-binding protein, partial [Stenotrophomonas sp.]
RLLAPLAASKGLHLHCVLDPALQAGSLVDGLRLRQILFNLAGNALKFTAHGGVELRLQVLRQAAAGQHLRLQVADTGVGISPERQRAVFAPYTQAEASTTRRFGGSGLGLAICRELAAALGGELQLHSVPDEGTTVSLDLYLPACDAPSASAPQAVQATAVAGSVRQ